MYRSHCSGEQENPEFSAIKSSEHIEQVWLAMENNFDGIWDSLTKHCSGADAASVLKEKFKVTVKSNSGQGIINYFSDAIKEFDEESAPYRIIFNDEYLQEIQDYDSGNFKGILRKECPVIRNGVNSKREAMKEWQMKFKATPSHILLDMCVNLFDFGVTYNTMNAESVYSKKNEYVDFEVESLDDDVEFRIEGVIGSGIKSTIIFYLFPRIFPQLNRLTMYGMYFLSGKHHFDLKSGSSEFLMIGDEYRSADHGIKMDHNYWYPYGLVLLYTLRIYRKIKEKLVALKIPVVEDHRYVYVNAFFEEIWRLNHAYISTMMCTDEGDL